jgi:hypothetical protein
MFIKEHVPLWAFMANEFMFMKKKVMGLGNEVVCNTLFISYKEHNPLT